MKSASDSSEAFQLFAQRSSEILEPRDHLRAYRRGRRTSHVSIASRPERVPGTPTERPGRELERFPEAKARPARASLKRDVVYELAYDAHTLPTEVIVRGRPSVRARDDDGDCTLLAGRVDVHVPRRPHRACSDLMSRQYNVASDLDLDASMTSKIR